jgi:hypothetical protein
MTARKRALSEPEEDRTMTRSCLLAVLTSLAALALTAPASAAPTFKEKLFWVSLHGTRTTTWRYSHASTGTCDSGYHGEGVETVKFAIEDPPRKMTGFFLGTGRPILVRYWGLPFGSEPANYFAKATIERESSDDAIYKPPPEWCPDRFSGGPEDEPPSRDCGKRGPFKYRVRLEYEKKNRLHVLEDEPLGFDDPYKNCHAVGSQLALDDVAPLELSESKLLRLRREVHLNATGKGERPLENGFVRTTIHYELTIEPVKHRRTGP